MHRLFYIAQAVKQNYLRYLESLGVSEDNMSHPFLADSFQSMDDHFVEEEEECRLNVPQIVEESNH